MWAPGEDASGEEKALARGLGDTQAWTACLQGEGSRHPCVPRDPATPPPGSLPSAPVKAVPVRGNG